MLKLEKESNSRNVSVIKDALGHNVVMINDIIFRGKRGIKWIDVEEYLRQYVGEFYTIAETNEVVYIGTDLPELIITATNMEHTDNSKAKHKKDAKYGWYKYESRFALPVFAGDGEVERYNVFHVAMILRHDKDGKKYLYDIMNIKKETSDLFQSENLTQ